MPQVPELDNFGAMPSAGSVGRVSAPDATNYAPREMQQLGGALSHTGQQVSKIAMDIQDTLNDAHVREQENKLSEALRALQHDPQTGYFNKAGKDAVTSYQDTVKAVDDIRAKLNEGVPQNEVAQRMWQQVADRRVNMARQQIDTHAAAQTRVYNVGETQARIKNATADATANYATAGVKGGMYETARATALSEFGNLARLNGLGEDQIQAGKLGVLTGLHSSVVDAMLSNDQTQQARQYVDQHANEIAPEQLDAIHKTLKTAGLKTDSLSLSFQMPSDVQGATSRLDTLFKNGEISAELRDATLSRVEQRYQMAKQGQEESKRALYGQAQDFFIKNPGKSVLDLPANIYAALERDGQLASMKSFAEHGAWQQNDAAYAGLLTMPQAELAAMTPAEAYNKFRGQLDDQHLEHVYTMIKSAQNAQLTLPEQEVVSIHDRMLQSARNAGVIPGDPKKKPDEAQTAALGQFNQAVQKQVDFMRAEVGGRKLTGEEIQKAIDKVTSDTVKKSTWFGEDKEIPTAVLTKDQAINAYVQLPTGRKVTVSSISDADRMRYAAILKNRKLPVTSRTLAALWASEHPEAK